MNFVVVFLTIITFFAVTLTILERMHKHKKRKARHRERMARIDEYFQQGAISKVQTDWRRAHYAQLAKNRAALKQIRKENKR